MAQKNPFKWKHFEGEIIVSCVRWYLRYSLSYRNLEEMILERGRGLIAYCHQTKKPSLHLDWLLPQSAKARTQVRYFAYVRIEKA